VKSGKINVLRQLPIDAVRSRQTSSTTPSISSTGSSGFSRWSTGRSRETNTTSRLPSRSDIPLAVAIHHFPTQLMLDELDRRLLDEVVFGVSAYDSITFRIMAK
jgi:hypothetical protein